MENGSNGIEPNSVTYWESRTINIGDYEQVSFGATSVIKFINQTEKKVELKAKETIECYPRMNDAQAFDTVKNKITEILNQREKTIRLQSNSQGGTSFDTLQKALAFGVVTEKEIGITDTESKPAGIEFEKLNAKVAAKKAKKSEIDLEFEEEFDEPAKPVKSKSGKAAKSKFTMAIKGGIKPPPAGLGDVIIDDEL